MKFGTRPFRTPFNGRLPALLAGLSLALCVATLALWSRSYRALDELDGTLGQWVYEVQSYGGACHLRLLLLYQERPGARGRPSQPPSFNDLELYGEGLPPAGFTVYRSRWPLRRTGRWRPDAAWFGGFESAAWLAWARDGPGRWTWVRTAAVPYWMQAILFGLPPLAWIAARCRRRAGRLVFACRACGYDLQASSTRCPECGAASGGGPS